MKWGILFLAIVSEVVATSALKFSDGFSKLVPTIIVIVGYGISFYLLSLTLKSLPIGITYAIWSGAGIVFISLIGWLFMGQKLDMASLVGIAFIIAGVMIINLLSRSAHL